MESRRCRERERERKKKRQGRPKKQKKTTTRARTSLLSSPCGVLDLALRCTGLSVCYVISHAAVEEYVVLRYDSNVSPKRVDGHGFDVDVLQLNRPGLRVVQAGEQLQNCALATSCQEKRRVPSKRGGERGGKKGNGDDDMLHLQSKKCVQALA